MIVLLKNTRTDGVERVWKCEADATDKYLEIKLPEIEAVIEIRKDELKEALK